MTSLLNTIKPLTNIIKQRPVLAVYEVNLQCNSRCGYCDLPLNKGRYELSRQEIQTIFQGLYNDGIRYLLVQGGEPTLRKDLLEILQDLHNIGFELALITNGTRLTDEFLDKLKTLPVSISVSLDSLDRETYKLIRGADQLRLVQAGIERMHDYPHPKYVTCIVSKQNLDEVVDVVRYAIDNGCIPVVGAYHWDIERYGKVTPELQYEQGEMQAVFEQVVESGLVPKGYFHQYLIDNINWLAGKGLEQCDAGRYSIAIDASGNVSPCLALKHAGNLRDSSLEDILIQFDRDQINKCSAQSSCNMLCSRVVGSNLRHPITAFTTSEYL